MEAKLFHPADKFIYVYPRKKPEELPGSGDEPLTEQEIKDKNFSLAIDFSGEIQKDNLSRYLSRPNIKVDFRPPRIVLSRSDRLVNFTEMNRQAQELIISDDWSW